MENTIITITLLQNDYMDIQVEEGWAGTTEAFVKNMERRVEQAIMAQVGWFNITVQHGLGAGIAVQVPQGTNKDVWIVMVKVLRTLAWVGV